jgi:hypothetical protein
MIRATVSICDPAAGTSIAHRRAATKNAIFQREEDKFDFVLAHDFEAWLNLS